MFVSNVTDVQKYASVESWADQQISGEEGIRGVAVCGLVTLFLWTVGRMSWVREVECLFSNKV